MDRGTKQEITSPQTWQNDKASFNDNIRIPEFAGGDNGSEKNGSQNPLHLKDTMDIFSHFQKLSLRHRNTNHDIEVMKTDLKRAEQDISEERDAFLKFQLGQKELRSIFEEQAQCLVTLEGQFHIQGDGHRGRVVDKNFFSRMEALEKSSAEKNRIIRQQSQQISDLMHTVNSLRPFGSKALSPKPTFRDNHVTSSYAAAGYEEGKVEGRVEQLEERLEELVKQTTALKSHTQHLEMQLQASLASTHNGSFLWRIPEMARRKRDAIQERITSVYSPPFYTGR